MKKIIYHGSINKIEKPVYGYGKVHNDYGLCFYCTEDIELAKEWSVDQNNNGYVNEYEIEMDGLEILDLSKYEPLYWLAILLANRTFNPKSPLAIEAKQYLLENYLLDITQYDIIVGYRADDSYFAFANDFINGAISYRQLCQAIKLGDLGMQIAIKSQLAFSRIKYIRSCIVDKDQYYPLKNNRDLKARKTYFDSRNNKRTKGDIYITNILDEWFKEDDSRL